MPVYIPCAHCKTMVPLRPDGSKMAGRCPNCGRDLEMIVTRQGEND